MSDSQDAFRIKHATALTGLTTARITTLYKKSKTLNDAGLQAAIAAAQSAQAKDKQRRAARSPAPVDVPIVTIPFPCETTPSPESEIPAITVTSPRNNSESVARPSESSTELSTTQGANLHTGLGITFPTVPSSGSATSSTDTGPSITVAPTNPGTHLPEHSPLTTLIESLNHDDEKALAAIITTQYTRISQPRKRDAYLFAVNDLLSMYRRGAITLASVIKALNH